MALLQLWIAIPVILGIYILWTRRRVYLLMSKVPGSMGYPLIGIAYKLMRREDILSVCGSLIEKYGPMQFSWFGPMPFFAVIEPELVKDILTSPHCVNKSPYVYNAVKSVAGEGLLILTQPHWNEHRKVLNPAFKHNALLSFLPILNKETGDFLRLMDNYVGQGGKDLMEVLQNLSIRVTTQNLLGCDVKDEPSITNNTLMHSYERLMELATTMVYSPWLRIGFIRKLWGIENTFLAHKLEISDFAAKIIEKNLSQVSTTSNNDSRFINLAIQQLRNGNFTYNNVLDHCKGTLFGSFDTTANVIDFTLMLLAMFPEYQEMVYQELQELFPQTGDFTVSHADLQNMPYLDRVVNESMRLMPPGPLIARQSSQDVKLSNGLVVPKGTTIGISIFHLHRRKDIWGPEAETFNPDNFLPHNIQARHPYAFIPFAKGIRNCIGWRYGLMSVKLTLAKLLRNYKFSTCFDYANLVFVESVTLKLKETPLLELERRIA